MKKLSIVLFIISIFTLSLNYVKADDYDNCMQKCTPELSSDPSACSRACYDMYKSDSDISKTYNKITCGESEIPYIIPQIVRTIILILQIATPLIIILVGSIDLVRAVIAQKDDEIKKGQQTFIKRLLIGAVVFLVIFMVETIIGLVAPKNQNEDMWNCIDCFVNGDCKTH